MRLKEATLQRETVQKQQNHSHYLLPLLEVLQEIQAAHQSYVSSLINSSSVSMRPYVPRLVDFVVMFMVSLASLPASTFPFPLQKESPCSALFGCGSLHLFSIRGSIFLMLINSTLFRNAANQLKY